MKYVTVPAAPAATNKKRATKTFEQLMALVSRWATFKSSPLLLDPFESAPESDAPVDDSFPLDETDSLSAESSSISSLFGMVPFHPDLRIVRLDALVIYESE